MKSKRNDEAFEQPRKQLETLILQDKNDEVDLFYFDESGFSLTPAVPYAWQTVGETIKIPCSRASSLMF